MSDMKNIILNLSLNLAACYIWDKRSVIKAFIKNVFLYLQLIVSSVIIMALLRRCSEKTQLIILAILIIVIAVTVAENKYLKKNNVAQ